MKMTRVAIPLTVTFILAGLFIPAAGVGEDRGDIDEFTAWLDSRLPMKLKVYGVPGAAVALTRNGEVAWSNGYGLADKKSGERVTADTLFQMASISKPVSAWGVMRLVESGKISLDDPIEKYLTRWRLPSSRYDHSGVTVKRVLSHTAGLSLHGYPGYSPSRPLPSITDSLSGIGTPTGPVRVKKEPGSGFSYSGGGFTALQLVMEEVSGDDFAAYMKREILDPLGMSSSGFGVPENEAAMAAPYNLLGARIPKYRFTELAAAGLYSSANDMARFVAAMTPGPNGEQAGRAVITPDSIRLMTTPSPESDDLYGLGYFIRDQKGVERIALHGGSNRGYQSLIAVILEDGLGLVVLTNGDSGSILALHIMDKWIKWSLGSRGFKTPGSP